MNIRNDYSFLFGNSSSNSIFGNYGGGFSLSDYASIKNGSYGKLMKAYYAEQKKTNAASKTDTADKTNSASASKKNSYLLKDNSELGKVKQEAGQLKTATEALGKDDLWKQTDGKYDTDKIMSAVKDFVKEYNDTLTQTGKVNSKDIAQRVGYMKSMTTTMSKSLAKIGISTDASGKMTLDEEAFKKADMKVAKSLFSNGYSYGSEISDKASQISSAADRSASLYGNTGTNLNSTLNSMFNSWV